MGKKYFNMQFVIQHFVWHWEVFKNVSFSFRSNNMQDSKKVESFCTQNVEFQKCSQKCVTSIMLKLEKYCMIPNIIYESIRSQADLTVLNHQLKYFRSHHAIFIIRIQAACFQEIYSSLYPTKIWKYFCDQ
jgi:hypothetical protein